MYLWIVALLLILITLFHCMREGMELENILDKSTILATETEVQLPNRLSGTRGKDLTFAGNINLEKNHALELGKGIDKGRNAGKMLYSKDKVEIFGAGSENTPYKMKLWDNVEVGGLLQVTDGLKFGKDGQGNIQQDKDNKTLNLKGYGEEGSRKVRIWDDVEVGQLFSKNGIEVRGPIQAYSDLKISGNLNANGKIQANNGMSVLGDVDIVGNITNVSLTNRLQELENTIKMNGNVPSVDNVLVSNLQKEVATLTQLVNSDISNISSKLTDIIKKVNTDAVPAVPAATSQVNGLVSQGNFTKLSDFDDYTNFDENISKRIAEAVSTVYEKLGAKVDISGSDYISISGLKTTLALYEDKYTNMSNKLEKVSNSLDNISYLSNIKKTHVRNLEPLGKPEFRPEFLELGMNPNLSFDILRDAIDDEKDLNPYSISLLSKAADEASKSIIGFNKMDASFNIFWEDWYADEKMTQVAGGGPTGLTPTKGMMNNLRQMENTTKKLDFISKHFNADNVSRDLYNFSTTTNATIDNLSTYAVKRNDKGDVNIPGELNIGTNNVNVGSVAKYIWNLFADDSLKVTRKDAPPPTAAPWTPEVHAMYNSLIAMGFDSAYAASLAVAQAAATKAPKPTNFKT